MKVWSTLILVVGLLMVVSCEQKKPLPPSPPPQFAAFSAAPTPLCTNLGVPIVRAAWSVEGEGKSCLANMKLNGSDLDGVHWSLGVQTCGEGDYGLETAFSLRDVFQNNIPSSITISAELRRQVQAGSFVNSELLDTASASITAQECQPGFNPGN